MKKKAIIAVGIFLTIILVAAGVIHYARLAELPENCNLVNVTLFCAKISDVGEIQPVQGKINIFSANLDDGKLMKQEFHYKQAFRYIASMLRQLDCTKTEEIPTDAQIVQISFVDYCPKNYNVLWEEYIAYDFYTKNLYVFRAEQWYIMKRNEKLDAFVQNHLDSSLQHTVWRGQSTYIKGEDFGGGDFENATFRYHLYWAPNVDALSLLYPEEERLKIQRTGFNNTEEKEVHSRNEAIACAAEELNYDNPIAATFYDETCGYWMVEIANDNGSGIIDKEKNYISFVEPVYTVIMDEKGRTLEVYKGYTRVTPFYYS